MCSTNINECKYHNNGFVSVQSVTVTIRPGDVPWMTTEIRKSIKHRNRMHKLAKRVNTGQAWADFRHVRNTTTTLMRKTKLAHQQ